MSHYQPTICVITPTIGRPTLKRTLESGQLTGGDQWLLLSDGHQPDVHELWNRLKADRPYLHWLGTRVQKGEYGNLLRDTAMSLSKKDYFIFLDDDDIFAPNAIDIIKREIALYYPNPIMFKMINGNGEILWKTRDVTPGNVGGSMFCCPNNRDRLATWANGAGHRSDFEFIRGTLEKYGADWRQQLRWSGDVIIHCRPEDI